MKFIFFISSLSILIISCRSGLNTKRENIESMKIEDSTFSITAELIINQEYKELKKLKSWNDKSLVKYYGIDYEEVRGYEMKYLLDEVLEHSESIDPVLNKVIFLENDTLIVVHTMSNMVHNLTIQNKKFCYSFFNFSSDSCKTVKHKHNLITPLKDVNYEHLTEYPNLCPGSGEYITVYSFYSQVDSTIKHKTYWYCNGINETLFINP